MFTFFALEASTTGELHGVTQGALTSIQGGKFWNSFAAGSISSLASSAWTGGGDWNGVGGDFGQSGVGTIAFGTIAGGAGSYLTGGNFWQGAVTGLVVSTFNHYLHDNPNPKLKRKFNRELKIAFGNRLDEDSSSYNGGATKADVDIILGTDTISTISNNSGNPSVKIMDYDTSTEGASSTYHSTAEELYGPGLKAASPGQSGVIRIYEDCFRTPRYLANKILHEFGHAYARYTGFTLNNFNAYGWTSAIHREEIRAYSFANQFGVSYFENGRYQSGLQKSINALGLKW